MENMNFKSEPYGSPEHPELTVPDFLKLKRRFLRALHPDTHIYGGKSAEYFNELTKELLSACKKFEQEGDPTDFLAFCRTHEGEVEEIETNRMAADMLESTDELIMQETLVSVPNKAAGKPVGRYKSAGRYPDGKGRIINTKV